uniref:Fibronectin type-III domain-containing protein n=1 Tax=Haemonchus contortus TaxID=6289 RepID=A0A7I4XSA4_HAECO
MNGRYLLLTSILLEALCYGVASEERLILKHGAKFNLICEGYRTTLYDCRWDFEDKDGNVKQQPRCTGTQSDEYATESGVYKCYVKGPNEKEFKHTSTVPVTVFKDAPQKPKVVLKKIDVRPRGIEISWEAESIEYVPTRKIKVFVTKAGFPEEMITETAEQSGNVTYAVNNDGGRFIVLVTDTFVDDLTSKSEEEEVSFETVDDIKVIDLKHEVDLNDITLKWDATGMRKDEQPVYEVRVMTMKKGSKVLNKTIKATEKTTKWKIEYRPEKYFVIVVATIGLYEGPPSNEVTVDVTELAPTDAPSVVGAKVNSPAEVYIMFKPLPLDKLPGIDLGCKVYLCLEQRVNIDCKVKTAAPRVDKVLYEDLIGGRVYWASVQCLTGAGPSPMSSWISVDVAKSVVAPRGKGIGARREKDVRVRIVAESGRRVIVSWSFEMRNGSRFDPNFVQNLRVMQYIKADGKYVLDRILTEDRGLRSVDAGLSPGFKFDTNCYFYAINVSFQSNRSAYEATDEMCYSFFSPSYLLLYGAIIIIILLMIGISYQLSKPGKTKAGKAAKGTPKKKKGKQKSKDSKSKDSKSKDSKSKDSKSKDSRSKDSKGSKEAEKQEEK